MPTVTFDAISAAALHLSDAERYALAARLLNSVTEKADVASVEAAWSEEIQARLCRYEAGEAKTTPAEQVFADLEKTLKENKSEG